jgi:hypothetical protein
MDQLYTVASNKKYDESTKLRISYDVLNGASKFKLFAPTVKHYLTKQVRTRLVYINPSEWDIALFLPIQKFVGAKQSKVWSDSRKAVRGR